MKFLLCSDLHLSAADKDYALRVLREIIGLCGKEKCGALLFAGDVFDSWTDAETLRADFRVSLEELPSVCAVYFLPGNHEELRAPGPGELEKFDFGRAKLLSGKPYTLLPLCAEAELLAIPFQKDYAGYRGWNVPPKKKPLRILLAHGTVSGFSYTGPGENSEGVLDEDIFAYFGADLAAMGHLHGYSVIRKGETLVAYPGSARVWREGEPEPRRVLVGTTEIVPPALEAKILRSAGEYKIVPVYISPSGELQVREPEKISAADWLRIEAAGVVEDESSVMETLAKLKNRLEKKCRKVTMNTDKVSVLAGVSAHPLALRFLRGWEEAAARYQNEEAGVYELSRLSGLQALKEILESRK